MSKVLSFQNKKYQIQTFFDFKLVFYTKMDIIEICPFGCPFGFCDMVEKGRKRGFSYKILTKL